MRKNDTTKQKNVFRSGDRLFQANGQWYFAAREGDIGPFRTREQAQREAEAFTKAKTFAAETGAVKRGQADERGIPNYLYRNILSMEQPVNQPGYLVIDVERID